MKRGRLRVYMGAAPGVGKTYAMLDEGRRRRDRGTDVVVGLVETHGRANTIAKTTGLEIIPRRQVIHRGAEIHELDVDAVIERRPQVALVDELAHTNITGMRNAKRWQDIDELLDAGIDVITTVNIQHLESVNDVVERITGIEQRETVPDAWVRAADQIELVDMTPEALRRRMAHGNIYPADRVDAALSNYFRLGNLGALRELALLWLADRVEEQLQTYVDSHGIARPWETRERVLVAMTGAPESADVIRRAARIARRVGGTLIGVHVVSSDGRSPSQSNDIEDHRRLIAELGGVFREIVGDDVALTLASSARSERATQVVIGASRRSRLHEAINGSVVNRLVRLVRDVDVHVISLRSDDPVPPTTHGWRRLATPLPRSRRTLAWATLVALLPVTTALLLPFRPGIGVATPLLVVLGVVVVVGALGGLVPGLVGALVSGLLANYLFIPPYGNLTITHPQDALALLVFVAVGATVATLVDSVARRAADVVEARHAADALTRGATALVTSPDPVGQILEDLAESVELGAAAVLRESDDGTFVPLATAGLDPPSVPAGDLQISLDDSGRTVLVITEPHLHPNTHALVEGFAVQLSAAIDAHDLRRAALEAAAAVEADALRSGILQSVSHDLRTPLAGIKAAVTSLLDRTVHFAPEDTEELLVMIESEADRLDGVVGNLLDMSRLQAGAINVLIRPTPLEEVVSAAIAGLAADRRRVRIEVDSDLPMLATDPVLLERAIANVLANALEFEPIGGRVVLEGAAVGGHVLVRVIDHGRGIAVDDRSRLLTPFQRLGDRSSQAGVGLGLAIAAGFTVAVGGVFDLEDTPGGGLTVVFRIPSAPGASAGTRLG